MEVRRLLLKTVCCRYFLLGAARKETKERLHKDVLCHSRTWMKFAQEKLFELIACGSDFSLSQSPCLHVFTLFRSALILLTRPRPPSAPPPSNLRFSLPTSLIFLPSLPLCPWKQRPPFNDNALHVLANSCYTADVLAAALQKAIFFVVLISIMVMADEVISTWMLLSFTSRRALRWTSRWRTALNVS